MIRPIFDGIDCLERVEFLAFNDEPAQKRKKTKREK